MKEHFIHTDYGYCYYTLEEIPILFGLYVEPEFRRQGHARWLVQECIKMIHKNGYKGKIMIEAKPKENSITTEALINFYKKMGLTVL
jgi:ribosomal protein S18 acetylase RimI-like enzyme